MKYNNSWMLSSSLVLYSQMLKYYFFKNFSKKKQNWRLYSWNQKDVYV